MCAQLFNSFCALVLVTLFCCGQSGDNRHQVSPSDSSDNRQLGGEHIGEIESSPFKVFLEKVKNNLPYSPSLDEIEMFFDKTYGSDLLITDVRLKANNSLLIYQLSEASSDELIVESFDQSDARLDKLSFTSDFPWKFEFSNSTTFSVSVKYEGGISIWDQQFFRCSEDGRLIMLNWSEDWSGLKNLSKEQLRILRNRVFARHGYIFKSPDLTTYFSRFSWYSPRLENVDAVLSAEDKEFLAHISKLSN